ncbi:hypothetical protein [Kocuria sp. CPCC 205263]|uniref:hypothetical protein n=1 Tax=Kocuria sp. CPCC 205263 TaxID=3073555 RepID=UPI0034D66946
MEHEPPVEHGAHAEVVTALESRHSGLRFRRDEDGSLHRFGAIPLTATGVLSGRPFVFTYRGDLARFRVWPTGTQTPSVHDHRPSGFPKLESSRGKIVGDPLSSSLTAEQLIEVLGEMIKMALTHLKPGPDALLPVTITMPDKLLEPEQVTALLAPFTGRDLPPQEALLDCTGLTSFSLDALGRLAERTTELFNITTLVGASDELAEAFTDEAQAEAVRQMERARMARRQAEREGRG